MLNQPLPPLSLYIHIPWCVRKCPYCDFNSHTHSGTLPEADYIRALIDDLQQEQQRLAHQNTLRPLHSIFIGGGTPSLFSSDGIATLLEQVDRLMGISSTIEITLEANPGTFEQQRFSAYKTAGVNRLSLGIQSFNRQHLQALGRIHDDAEAHQAVSQARCIFERINLDIMHGLPDQTLEEALSDLEKALHYQPDHLSWYQLTLEPNTAFYSKPPKLPVDETLWDIHQQGQALLSAHHLSQYETSAYAITPQQRSQHNLNYWRFGDYLGIGAGAHGKVSQWQEGTLAIERHHKRRQPKHFMSYLEKSAGRFIIAQDDIAFEFMLNALRMTEGFPITLFESTTGLSLDTLSGALQKAHALGLIEQTSGHIKPTPQGQLFLNNLLDIFLP